jgi:putative ABC transport system permease protein
MRPEAPARFRRPWIERALPLRLTPAGRIILRNLTRRPLRTLGTVLGVRVAGSLLVGGLIFFASFRYSFDLQFRVSQGQDVTLVFNAPRGAGVRYDLARLPGVERVEGFRTVPVRLRAGHHTRQLALTGMEARPQLARIVGADGRAHALPADGLLLSAELARVLEVAPGDSIVAEVLDGARPTMHLPVAGTVDDVFGTHAYADLPALAHRLDEAPTLSGAHLRVSPDRLPGLLDMLKRMPSIAGVTSPAAMLRNFEESIARNLGVNLAIISAFAGVIAIGVIYNGARIALSESGRELASLRVLGFTRHEVAVILLGEQAVITALGIPVGAALGALYAWVWVASLNGETYRIPLLFPASAFVIAGSIIAGVAVCAGLLVRRRLGRLDLISVLKTRE